jgi:hypothetical protein
MINDVAEGNQQNFATKEVGVLNTELARVDSELT